MKGPPPGPRGRISPGPTRTPPMAGRRLVPAKSNLKPQTSSRSLAIVSGLMASGTVKAIGDAAGVGIGLTCGVGIGFEGNILEVKVLVPS